MEKSLEKLTKNGEEFRKNKIYIEKNGKQTKIIEQQTKNRKSGPKKTEN